MNKVRTLIALGLLALTLLASSTATKAADRKVNEYEGQHVAMAGDPSQWG
jgi:hypothetical protein